MFMKFQQPQRSQCIIERQSKLGSKEYAEPVDFVLEPYGFSPKLENLEMRAWALEVHALWKKIRKVLSSVHD